MFSTIIKLLLSNSFLDIEKILITIECVFKTHPHYFKEKILKLT